MQINLINLIVVVCSVLAIDMNRKWKATSLLSFYFTFDEVGRRGKSQQNNKGTQLNTFTFPLLYFFKVKSCDNEKNLSRKKSWTTLFQAVFSIDVSA